MDFSNNSTSSDRQNYPSSGASSTRHILISPAARNGSHDHLQPSTSGERQSYTPHRLRSPSVQKSSRRPSHSREERPPTKSNLLLTESFSTGAVPTFFSDRYLADNNSNGSSTCSNFSTRSAPQTGLRSEFSVSTNRDSHRDRRGNSKRRHLDFERPRYLRMSTPMVELMIKHRRPLLAILFTILYASYGLSSIISRSVSQPGSGSHSSSGYPASQGEWTQEMIAGWHLDRPIVLANEFSGEDTGDRHVKVRECRSRAQQHHKQLQVQHQQQNATVKLQEGNKQVSGNKSAPPVQVIRRRHRFEALNGCFFRREITSESTGDLCCCAGIPRFIMEPIANSSKSAVNHTASTTLKPLMTNSTKLSTTMSSKNSSSSDDIKQRTPRKKYLKPQVMCFVSAAANLFNAQKLVAPIANEHNLMHTFIKGKGKCITCSCCHEHDPEKVNKLLANVPLYANKFKSKSMMLDKNGNQLVAPSNGDDEDNTGLWVRMRNHLVACMHRLDDLFFWLYDLLDLTTFVARYGYHPVNFTDSTGLLLIQTHIVPQKGFEAPKSLFSTSARPTRSTEAPNLFIDDDLYSDFTTTTTTTSTTTTTTAKPARTTSKGPKRRKKKRRHRTTSTSKSPVAGATSGRPQATTTTKSPTVIINVYAGNNLPTSLKEPTTTSTKKPSIMLITSDVGRLSTASGLGNLELHINLNAKKDDNSTATVKTDSGSYLSVPSIELNSPTATLPPTIMLAGNSSGKANKSTTTEPRLVSTLLRVESESDSGRNSNQSQTFSLATENSYTSGEIQSKVPHLPQFDSAKTTQLPLGFINELSTIHANVTEKPATNDSASLMKPSITISLDQGNSSTIIATINTTQFNPSTLIEQTAVPAMATHPTSVQDLPPDVGRSASPVSINFSQAEPSLKQKVPTKPDGDPSAAIPLNRATTGLSFAPKQTLQLNTSLILENTQSDRRELAEVQASLGSV